MNLNEHQEEEFICQLCGDDYSIKDSDSQDYASFCSKSCQVVAEEDGEELEVNDYE